jgi:Na+/H+ antiporter NhaD/arsenite permease-like protein
MVILESQGKPSSNQAKRDEMFQFIKSNKMFSALIVFVAVLCYGFAVRNVIAIAIGSLMLVAAIAYSFVSSHKEAQSGK